jgi:hypothetical protein
MSCPKIFKFSLEIIIDLCYRGVAEMQMATTPKQLRKREATTQDKVIPQRMI